MDNSYLAFMLGARPDISTMMSAGDPMSNLMQFQNMLATHGAPPRQMMPYHLAPNYAGPRSMPYGQSQAPAARPAAAMTSQPGAAVPDLSAGSIPTPGAPDLSGLLQGVDPRQIQAIQSLMTPGPAPTMAHLPTPPQYPQGFMERLGANLGPNPFQFNNQSVRGFGPNFFGGLFSGAGNAMANQGVRSIAGKEAAYQQQAGGVNAANQAALKEWESSAGQRSQLAGRAIAAILGRQNSDAKLFPTPDNVKKWFQLHGQKAPDQMTSGAIGTFNRIATGSQRAGATIPAGPDIPGVPRGTMLTPSESNRFAKPLAPDAKLFAAVSAADRKVDTTRRAFMSIPRNKYAPDAAMRQSQAVANDSTAAIGAREAYVNDLYGRAKSPSDFSIAEAHAQAMFNHGFTTPKVIEARNAAQQRVNAGTE